MSIEHIIVLMLENRSFDHMLGYLKRDNPQINGLTGKESNPITLQSTEQRKVSSNATYLQDIDPGHDLIDTNMQLFGSKNAPDPPIASNNGFIVNYTQHAGGDTEIGATIMRCFDKQKLPVLYRLAEEFAVCDNWFASVPGPTWPNRFFVHAASSKGHVGNDYLVNYNMRTIYENLNDAQKTWRIYYHDIPHSLALSALRKSKNRKNFFKIQEFFTDAQHGNLPHYTFIEPRYFNFLSRKANDQHPGNDVKLGELLIADVYEAIRSNDVLWKTSLLLIVYDEHGGFYDHVAPPYHDHPIPVLAPDNFASTNPPFKFDRLGPRIAAVAVSPYIKKGSVDHTIYDHSSVPATLKKIFNLKNFLTKRDAQANTFEKLLTSTLRKDTPLKLSRPGAPAMIQTAFLIKNTEVTEKEITAPKMQKEMSQRPLSEYQQSLLDLANNLEPNPMLRALAKARPIRTEHDAAVQVRERVEMFLNKPNRR